MTKIIKKIPVPFISLLFLINMSSDGNAETTISAEGQYIFNTLAFYIGAVLVALITPGVVRLHSSLFF